MSGLLSLANELIVNIPERLNIADFVATICSHIIFYKISKSLPSLAQPPLLSNAIECCSRDVELDEHAFPDPTSPLPTLERYGHIIAAAQCVSLIVAGNAFHTFTCQTMKRHVLRIHR